MATFPVRIGGTEFKGVDDLVQHVVWRAHNAVPAHPNDGHPVQWYIDQFAPSRGGPVEQALWEASARIVEDSDDAAELEMAAFLCGRCTYEPLYEAVLDRLDGGDRPFPPQLELPFSELGLRPFAKRHPSFGPRFRATYEMSGNHGAVISTLLAHDPHGELLTAFTRAAAAGAVTVTMVMDVATEVIHEKPGQVLAFASAVSGLSAAHREMFLKQVQKWAANWLAQNEPALRQALQL